MEDYGLEQFDDAIKPSKGFANNLDDLPDGDYDFLCIKAQLKKSQNAGKTVFEMTLCVESGEYAGVTGNKAVFLTTQDGVDIFSGELIKLGFDADKWTKKNERPFSKEFPKIVDQIAGLAFKGKKIKNKQGYTNINIKEKLGRREIPKAALHNQNDPFVPYDPNIPF